MEEGNLNNKNITIITKHMQSIWELKINRFLKETRLQALSFRNATSKISGVLKLLSQSGVKVLQSQVCLQVYFGEHNASAGDTMSVVTHTVIHQLPRHTAKIRLR